jgi:hypothetical protein
MLESMRTYHCIAYDAHPHIYWKSLVPWWNGCMCIDIRPRMLILEVLDAVTSKSNVAYVQHERKGKSEYRHVAAAVYRFCDVVLRAYALRGGRGEQSRRQRVLQLRSSTCWCRDVQYRQRFWLPRLVSGLSLFPSVCCHVFKMQRHQSVVEYGFLPVFRRPRNVCWGNMTSHYFIAVCTSKYVVYISLSGNV